MAEIGIDYEFIFGALVTIAWLVREIQHRNMMAKMDTAMAASSDEVAFIYDRATDGSLCTAAAWKEIENKAVKVWNLWAALGGSFAEILAQKSSLANTLKPLDKAEKPSEEAAK